MVDVVPCSVVAAGGVAGGLLGVTLASPRVSLAVGAPMVVEVVGDALGLIDRVLLAAIPSLARVSLSRRPVARRPSAFW